MERVFVIGLGAVSPAGWSAESLDSCLAGRPPFGGEVSCPDRSRAISVRKVPPPAVRPPLFAQPRLRRASPVTQYGVAAAFEALAHGQWTRGSNPPLGLVFSVMSGSVVYSRRFFEEVLQNPATASPLLFPETVFNAPASHVSACAASTGPNYTLVGDAGMFLQSLAIAGGWIRDGLARSVLVVGSEESDWTSAGALTRFAAAAVPSEGAGALLLSADRAHAKAELVGVTRPRSFSTRAARRSAAQGIADAIHAWDDKAAWFDGWSGEPPDPADIRGVHLTASLGDGLGAAGAWTCVAACSAIARADVAAAGVRIVGANQQAIGAMFAAPDAGAQNPSR